MQARTHLQALDHISLAQIFKYLHTSDVFHVTLTCKTFHSLISTSPYIIQSLFENLSGRKIPQKDLSNLTYAQLQETLKEAYILRKPLPFFGFRGNCGCDKNNAKYLFDKIFESRTDNSLVCTNSGDNFDIEGVLSEDYAREAKYIQNIISAIDQTVQLDDSHLYSFRGMLKKYGSGVFGLSPANICPLVAEKIQSLRKFQQRLSNFLRDQSEKTNIELPCQKMMKSIGLIQSCHIKRETEGLTCPVKTLVAFVSLTKEIRSSSLASLFGECNTSDDLLQLLKDHKNELPSINQTSIKKLAGSSPTIEYHDEEEDGVEFVVFKSDGKKQDVIPLFWVNFSKAIDKDLFLNFKGCNLSGRYVMLKLIQCEDLREMSGLPNHPKNIEMRSCCFYGPVVNL